MALQPLTPAREPMPVRVTAMAPLDKGNGQNPPTGDAQATPANGDGNGNGPGAGPQVMELLHREPAVGPQGPGPGPGPTGPGPAGPGPYGPGPYGDYTPYPHTPQPQNPYGTNQPQAGGPQMATNTIQPDYGEEKYVLPPKEDKTPELVLYVTTGDCLARARFIRSRARTVG